MNSGIDLTATSNLLCHSSARLLLVSLRNWEALQKTIYGILQGIILFTETLENTPENTYQNRSQNCHWHRNIYNAEYTYISSGNYHNMGVNISEQFIDFGASSSLQSPWHVFTSHQYGVSKEHSVHCVNPFRCPVINMNELNSRVYGW